MQLLKGISIDVKLNLWKKLADVILKVVEAGEIDSGLLPFLGAMAPAFLLRINANLDITVDEQMKKKIETNPMVEPVLLDAHTLVSMTSKVSSDEESDMDEYLNSKIPLPPAVDLVKILLKQLGDDVELTFVGNFLGLKCRLTGKDLNLLVRNAVKYGP